MIAKSDGSGTTSLAWDFENRLTQVVTPSSGNVTYKYDALGRRIQRTPWSGVSTNFSYDGADVVRDKNSDATTIDYLNGPGVDNKIWQKGATQYFFSQDHLGSTTALTNANGVLFERDTYDAYGNTAGGSVTRYGYAGRERDATTSLIFYRARWYDPPAGRFISEDPIGLGGGVNQFGYVRNNPENRIDPSGLYDEDVHFYLTYFLALKNKCFSDTEARAIAEFDQYTDENSETSPELGYIFLPQLNGALPDIKVIPDVFAQYKNATYHSLYEGSYEGRTSPELWRMALEKGRYGSMAGLGTFLHADQDSFAHDGFGDPACGHGCYAGHYPDNTNVDVPKTLRMAGATWKALNEFAKANCGCEAKWDPSWWDVIRRFAEVGYADPIQKVTRSLSPELIERKRLILDVPNRW